MRYHDNDQDDIILKYILALPPSRLEAELEEKHLREQEQLMKEVQAMKDVAQEEMERQKDEYEKKLVELETQMVRVWRVWRGEGGGWKRRGGERVCTCPELIFKSSWCILPLFFLFLISSSCPLSPPPPLL